MNFNNPLRLFNELTLEFISKFQHYKQPIFSSSLAPYKSITFLLGFILKNILLLKKQFLGGACLPFWGALKLFFTSISLLMLPYSLCVNALSATTLNTIQGRMPYIFDVNQNDIVINIDQLLSIAVPNESGISTISPSNANRAINFPKDKTFSEIKIKAISADNKEYQLSGLSNYFVSFDYDGDDGGVVTGAMKAVWKNNGSVISDLTTQPTAYGGPYTLTVSVENAIAETNYGDPRINIYGSKEVTYTFKQADMGITYLKPRDMTTYPVQSGLGGGYDNKVFDLNNGFLATNKNFPGTAFKGSGFYIIGSGADQSKYKCSISSGASDTLKLSTVPGESGQNCYVEYTNIRPTTDTTIELAYEVEPGKFEKIDSYTFKKPNKWLKYQSPKAYFTDAVNLLNPNSLSVFPAANVCAGNPATAKMTYAQSLSYFYLMQDITNIPLKADGSVTISGQIRFKRALDKTFMSVWGNIYEGYPNNDFYKKTAISSNDGVVYGTSTLWVGNARTESNTVSSQYVIDLGLGLSGWQGRANVFACKDVLE